MQQNTTKKQAEYAELLKKPQWQKRRLQMLEKAGWMCAECGAEEQQLHVHHKRYIVVIEGQAEVGEARRSASPRM